MSTPGSKTVLSNASATVAPDTMADTVASTHGRKSSRTGISSIPEETVERTTRINTVTREACTCGCHDPPLRQIERPIYANASVQADLIASPSRTSLRVDTFSASAWSTHSYSAVSREVRTPIFDNFGAAPFSMGRMTNYFSKPGYQLGDSLSSGYNYYEQPMYQYQDEFGDEALR